MFAFTSVKRFLSLFHAHCSSPQMYMVKSDGVTNSQCTASLVGTHHVVTAGHCVFSWNSPGTGWIQSARFICGQTDNECPFTTASDWTWIDQPYGTAWATYFRSYTGWTNSQVCVQFCFFAV
jgi:trypsin